MQLNIPIFIKEIKNRFLIKSAFYRLYRQLLFNVIKGKDKTKTEVVRVSQEDFKQNILELDRLCKKQGSTLILISPLYQRINYKVQVYRELLHEVANEYGLPLIFIKELTELSEMANDEYFDDPCHPNKLGHQRLMQALYNYIVDNGLIPNLGLNSIQIQS